MRHALTAIALALAAGAVSPRAAGGEEGKGTGTAYGYHLLFEQEDEVAREEAEGARGKVHGPAPAPGRATLRTEVWLAPRAVLVARGTDRTLYDFAGQRKRTWARGAAASASLPLEAAVDFRVSEFENRIRLAGPPGAAGAKVAALDPFEVETLFGVERTPAVARQGIAVEEEPDGTVFRLGGEEVARVEPSGNDPPSSVAGSWRLFLRWETRVHPAILERLLDPARVPSLLRYRWRSVGSRTRTTLRLVRAETGGARPEPVPPEEPGCDEGLRRALAAAAAAKAPDRDEAMAEFRALRDEGRPLEAFLALTSLSVSTGFQPEEEMKEFLRDESTRKQVGDLQSRLLATGDPERAAEARDWLAAKRTEDLRHGYMLDAFRAGVVAGMGETAEARALFAAVLAGHPGLAGTWHDLGKLYRNDWDMDAAWLCWEQALRMAPEHPMLGGVRGIRASLRRNHGAFFE